MNDPCYFAHSDSLLNYMSLNQSILLLFILCGSCLACSEMETTMEEPPFQWVETHTNSEFLDEFGGKEVTDETVAITGVVISSDETKNIVNELYIADETGALVVDVSGENLFEAFPVGSEVLVKCFGLAVNAAERRLTLAGGGAIVYSGGTDEAIILTGRMESVLSETVDPDNLDDDNLNTLISIEGFEFPESAVGKTIVQNSQETDWILTNADTNSITLRFSPDATFAEEVIPSGTGPVQGIYVRANSERVIKVVNFEDLKFGAPRRLPFTKREFQFEGNTLPYQIMFPQDYNRSEAYPLVVFLHGAGERGTNNTSQMAHGPSTFGKYQARVDYPSIVIFPQCPPDVMWSRRIKYTDGNGTLIFEFPVEDEPNYAMEMVIELVRTLMVEEGVDEKRIYITGLSMGGIGTFEFFYYAPDLPAAGSSMAGGHDPELASSYAPGLSFRLYHGSNDGVVPARYSKALFDELIELGVDASYTEAEGRGHEWRYVLNDPEYLEWLFSQSKE